MPEERQRCLDAGMVDHVTKPVLQETLVAAILRHRRRRQITEPAEPVAVAEVEEVGVRGPEAVAEAEAEAEAAHIRAAGA